MLFHALAQPGNGGGGREGEEGEKEAGGLTITPFTPLCTLPPENQVEDEGQRAERVGRGRIYPLAPSSLRSKFPAPGINWLMLSGYPAEGACGSDL